MRNNAGLSLKGITSTFDLATSPITPVKWRLVHTPTGPAFIATPYSDRVYPPCERRKKIRHARREAPRGAKGTMSEIKSSADLQAYEDTMGTPALNHLSTPVGVEGPNSESFQTPRQNSEPSVQEPGPSNSLGGHSGWGLLLSNQSSKKGGRQFLIPHCTHQLIAALSPQPGADSPQNFGLTTEGYNETSMWRWYNDHSLTPTNNVSVVAADKGENVGDDNACVNVDVFSGNDSGEGDTTFDILAGSDDKAQVTKHHWGFAVAAIALLSIAAICGIVALITSPPLVGLCFSILLAQPPVAVFVGCTIAGAATLFGAAGIATRYLPTCSRQEIPAIA